MDIEKRSTEVAVVGGGAAGLLAALEAHKAGAEVLLVLKTVPAGGSCTTLSLGAFRVSNTPESRNKHFAESVASGKNMNDRRLLKILVDRAFEDVSRLQEYDVPILYEPPYIYVLGKAPFYGRAMTSSLQRTVVGEGIMTMGQSIVIDLLKSNGRVSGLLAYSPNTHSLHIISARAVVLATGGAGALYALHDNSPRTTGDGFALAAKAGAALRNMEFVQFYPLGLVENGIFKCIIPPWLADSCRINNALGEDVLAKYGIEEKPAAVKARDACSRAMFLEISAGRGFGPCLEIDIRKATEKTWNQNRQLRHYKEILQERFAGLKHPLKIAPVCHHFMGGVIINENCETTLPGLFAAGEVTGGIHGANRMGGNALSECVVFGGIAGRQAASYARYTKGVSAAPGVTEKAKEQISCWLERSPDPDKSPRTFKKRLAKIMSANAGIIRSQKKLETAEEQIGILQKEILAGMSCKTSKDVMRAFELFNLVLTAKLVVKSALIRTESRGAHYREDFPDIDEDKWQMSTRIDKYPDLFRDLMFWQ